MILGSRARGANSCSNICFGTARAIKPKQLLNTIISLLESTNPIALLFIQYCCSCWMIVRVQYYWSYWIIIHVSILLFRLNNCLFFNIIVNMELLLAFNIIDPIELLFVFQYCCSYWIIINFQSYCSYWNIVLFSILLFTLNYCS